MLSTSDQCKSLLKQCTVDLMERPPVRPDPKEEKLRALAALAREKDELETALVAAALSWRAADRTHQPNAATPEAEALRAACDRLKSFIAADQHQAVLRSYR